MPIILIQLFRNENRKQIYNITKIRFKKIQMEAQRTDLLSYFATAGKNLGHKQAKCKQSPRCLKCGKNHIIETCAGPKSTQVVCAC